jgi:hypothetical protein
MIKIIALLGLLALPTYGGLKLKEKESPSSLSLDQVKQGTDELGNINLDLIAKLNAGDLVSFKLADRVAVGRVTKVEIVENEYIKVIGIFDKEEKAGFGFIFSQKEGKIGGTLLFEGDNVTYRLRYNENKKFFYLEKDQTPPIKINHDSSVKRHSSTRGTSV